MKYSIEDLTRDVMARLGEFPRPQISFPDAASADDRSYVIPWPEDIIALKVRSLLPEVGSRLIREAPSEVLGHGVVGASGLEVVRRLMPCGLYAAEVPLPEGFLRLGSVKMGEWRHVVSGVFGSSDSGWTCQWSSESGIAGCPERPRAYLDRVTSGPILRLLGSSTEEDTLEWLAIWSVPTPCPDGHFDFPATIYGELVSSISEAAFK